MGWLAASGCSIGPKVELVGIESGASLSPDVPVVAYRSADTNSADIYLTDLDADELDPATDPAGLTGHLVHIHLFLVPRPGRTPIDSTASSVTIRHVVLANGVMGLYGGGGFMRPSDRPGSPTLGGSIREATLRLVSSTDGFADRLGPTRFSASFKAPRDEGTAGQIAQRLEEVIATMEKK